MAATRARLKSQRKATEESIDWTLPIVDLVPELNQGYVRPRHLVRYCEVLDAAIAKFTTQSKRSDLVCVAAPPQHGKTTCTYVALLKAIMVGHGMRHMYVSYSQTRTESVAKQVRRLAESLGIVIEGGVNSWYIPATQSTIIWTSIGGVGSGEPVTGLLVVDDPFKDFAQARSKAFREQVRSWMVGVGLRRIHTTTTVVEMATRWHEEDLTAWMIDTMGAPYINIQGICEDVDDGTGRDVGDPLFQELHPAEMLAMQRQAQPQEFEAQYQGRPRAMGDALFDEPDRFIELPKGSFSTAYGADLAYSESTISDWSVCLKGRRIGDKVYVIGCYRRQLDANKVVPALRVMWTQEKAPMRWYYGGAGERGMVSFLQAEIANFIGVPAKSDKVIRSTNARSGWNLKRVLLPSEDSLFYGPWVEEVRKECMTFSGSGDAHDDIVDALAALVDQLMGASFNWTEVDGMNDALKSKRPVRGEFNTGGWARR